MDLSSEMQKEKQSGECKPGLREDEGIQKDSKRSWFVCVGAVLLIGISLGIANSFGVLFASWTQEFKESRTEIGKHKRVYYNESANYDNFQHILLETLQSPT